MGASRSSDVSAYRKRLRMLQSRKVYKNGYVVLDTLKDELRKWKYRKIKHPSKVYYGP
jgi:hypothetical protein